MQRHLLTLGFTAIYVSSLACAHQAMRPPKDLGREEVVERVPDDRPDWIETSFKEKKDALFFKGEVTGVSDRSLGMRQAKAGAIQNLVESIRIKARSEFSEAIKGVNVSQGTVGRYLDSVVAWTTDNLAVSGVVPEEEYYEKVSVRTFDGVGYRYNCYVWLRLPSDEYLRSRQQAADRAAQVAEDEEAKELAREVKRKLEDRP